jgi:nucleotide-binding universal stress UspA family protein
MNKKPTTQPILVPVDFSPHSEAALTFAATLADALGAPLVVMHVVHDPSEAPGYYAKKGKKRLRKMEDVAAEMMASFMQKAIEDHPERPALGKADTMLVVGLPVARILQMADKANAQMLVMGSQGRTGLAHLLIGSKAEQIVHLSPIPVTIVKSRKEKS